MSEANEAHRCVSAAQHIINDYITCLHITHIQTHKLVHTHL